MFDAIHHCPCQIYHSEDAVSKLRIRVRVGPRSTLHEEGGEEYSQGVRDVDRETRTHPAAGVGVLETDFEWKAEFGWMEKVTCDHGSGSAEASGRTSAEGRRSGRLFSNPLFADDLCEEPDDNTSRSRYQIARDALSRCFTSRHRHNMSGIPTAGAYAGHVLPCDRMQILFSATDTEEENIDILICQVHAHSSGKVLEVQPPFSSPALGVANLPCRFTLPSGAHHKYAVENASHVPTDVELRSAREARRGFDAAVPSMRQSLAGVGFNHGFGSSLRRLGIFGEIVAFDPDSQEGSSAGTWEDEAIFRSTKPVSMISTLWRSYYYVAYELSLASKGQWRVAESSDTSSGSSIGLRCTQRASLSGCAGRGHYVFNQPLELHLVEFAPDEVHWPPLDPIPPRLAMQVLRVDSWDRHQLHGYTFVDIPRVAGEHKITAPLWYPAGTVQQRLSGKLCGSFLPLASLHLVASSDSHGYDDLPRNRSSLRTISAAGRVHVRLQVITHERLHPRANLPGLSALPRTVPASDTLDGLRLRRRQRREAREGMTSTSIRQGITPTSMASSALSSGRFGTSPDAQ